MVSVKLLIFLLNIIPYISSDDHAVLDEDDYTMLDNNLNYMGGKFPFQYLVPDKVVPTVSDLNRYLNYLQRSLTFFGHYLNRSDVNVATAILFAKSTLKRTLLDERNKLQSFQINLMSKLINDAENILSHYIYRNAFYGWTDGEFKASKLMQNGDILVHNIEKFNRNRLVPWILSEELMHDFVEEIDEGTLPKEKFVELVNAMDEYFLSIADSDKCIERIAYNRQPLDVSTTHPCITDHYCESRIASSPSIAYSLSHRMLNIFLRLKLKNCYIKSEEEDLHHIDKLCAFMYREAVYIARRGFFARDLFLEHITLCASMGYIEFHRLQWFNKAVSWMNEHDCVKEFRNFEINRTKVSQEGTFDQKNVMLKWRCISLSSLCDNHPSALLMPVISHAIRYAAHFMQLS